MGLFFNRKEMKAKHKNPNGAPRENESNKEEEKLFDFDKGFKDNQGQNAPDEQATDGKVTQLETALNELKEKNLRLLAEFDNYKKRTSRERYELMNSASKD